MSHVFSFPCLWEGRGPPVCLIQSQAVRFFVLASSGVSQSAPALLYDALRSCREQRAGDIGQVFCLVLAPASQRC